MNAIAGTSLPKPTDWQAFERALCLLAQFHLSDPNAQLYGRSGQNQDGIDIIGSRDGDIAKSFAVQAKKADKPVTVTVLKDELKRAEKLQADLREYFFATTQPRDTMLQQAAITISEEYKRSGRNLRIVIWSWDDITDIARRYPDVWKAFDPTYSSFAEKEGTKLQAAIEGTEDRVMTAIAAIDAKLQDAASRATGESAERVVPEADENTPRQGKISAWLDLINGGQAPIAEAFLRKAIDAEWEESTLTEKYRLKAALAGACLKQGKFEEAASLLDDANAFGVYPKKVAINRAKAFLIRGEFEAAECASFKAIAEFSDTDDLYAMIVQARANRKCDNDPRQGIPKEALSLAEVSVGYIHWLRSRQDKSWTEEAKTAAKLHPDARFLSVLAAEAVLEDVTGNKQGYLGGAPALIGSHENLIDAANVLESYIEDHRTAGEHIDESAFHNAALSLRLVEDEKRALDIVTQGRECYPNSQSLMLQQAILLSSDERFDEALTALGDAPTDLQNQFLKAEILLNIDKADKAIEIVSNIDSAELPQERRRMIDSVKARAIAMTNSKEDAVTFLRERQAENPNELHLRSLEINILARLEERDQAVEALESAIVNVNPETAFVDVFELAGEADNIDAFDQVVTLLKDRVSADHLSAGLRMLMRACVNGGYRKIISDTLDASPDVLRATPFMRRIEAIFAINVGDPDAEAKVRRSLDSNPAGLDMTVSLALFLRAKNNPQNLKLFLDSIDVAALRGSPDDFITLAQLFVFGRLPEKGMSLGYTQLMTHWDKPSVHMRYHGLLFGADPDAKLVPHIDAVQMDTAVNLITDDGAKQVVLIDCDDLPAFSELRLNPLSDLGKALIGARLGDTVTVEGSISEKNYKIESIQHKWIFALHQSVEQFERRFPTTHGIRQLNFDENAEDPLVDIKELSKAQAERTDFVLRTYDENLFPHCMVAKNLGVDVVEAWIGLVAEKRRFKVCAGHAEELEKAINAIRANNRNGTLVDAVTAAMIRRFDIHDAIVNVVGDLNITLSGIEVFEQRVEELKIHEGREYLSIGWRNGGLERTSLEPREVQVAIDARVAELDWVKANCKILPAIPAKEPDQGWRQTFEAFPANSIDAAAAAQGSELLFLCEDFGFRAWAEGAYGVSATWLQPVLLVAQELDLINNETYANAMLSMVKAGHYYVSLNTSSLIEIARVSDFEVSDDLTIMLDMIGGPTANLGSNPNVVAGLIDAAIEKHGWSVTSMALASAVFWTMSKGRLGHKREIVGLILMNMVNRPLWMDVHKERWIFGHSIGE